MLHRPCAEFSQSGDGVRHILASRDLTIGNFKEANHFNELSPLQRQSPCSSLESDLLRQDQTKHFNEKNIEAWLLELDRHWQAIGFFDLKEDFVAIGLGILPAYWVCWRRPLVDEPGRTRAGLTAVVAFIVWWGFLVGHVLNNIMGFGS
jgi:hypothetical protein